MATIAVKNVKVVFKPSAPPSTPPDNFTPEIKLSARDSRIILAALQSPPKPNAKLKSAAARFKRLTAKKS